MSVSCCLLKHLYYSDKYRFYCPRKCKPSVFAYVVVFNFIEVVIFFLLFHVHRDADETISWIQEKDVVLSTDDYGRDLASVQTLQRKHDGVERDLAALEEKVLSSRLIIILFCVTSLVRKGNKCRSVKLIQRGICLLKIQICILLKEHHCVILYCDNPGVHTKCTERREKREFKEVHL